jgi:hypothetical protein
MRNINRLVKGVKAYNEVKDLFTDKPYFCTLATIIKLFKAHGYNLIYRKALKAYSYPVHLGWGLYTGCHNGKRYFVIPKDIYNISPWGI